MQPLNKSLNFDNDLMRQEMSLLQGSIDKDIALAQLTKLNYDYDDQLINNLVSRWERLKELEAVLEGYYQYNYNIQL